MPVYKAPLRDMKFLPNEVFDYPKHYASLASGENATPDIVDAILTECGRFCEEQLSPLYQPGDEEGCSVKDGVVTTPKGYKETYDQYVMGGWHQGLRYLRSELFSHASKDYRPYLVPIAS